MRDNINHVQQIGNLAECMRSAKYNEKTENSQRSIDDES